MRPASAVAAVAAALSVAEAVDISRALKAMPKLPNNSYPPMNFTAKSPAFEATTVAVASSVEAVVAEEIEAAEAVDSGRTTPGRKRAPPDRPKNLLRTKNSSNWTKNSGTL